LTLSGHSSIMPPGSCMEGVMSIAAQAPSPVGASRGFKLRPSHFYFWCVSLTWFALLGWNLATNGDELAARAVPLIPWVIVLAVVNMLPVSTWPHANFTPDVPINIAGILVLPPMGIAVATFIGCFDPKEFTGRIGLSKAAFNRSQVALLSYLSSLLAHKLAHAPSHSVYVLLLANLALATTLLLNYPVVALGIVLEHRCTVRAALRRMSVATPLDFILTLISWAVVGAMLAVLYEQIGPLALIAFLAPTLLGRQTLARSQMVIDTARAYRSREAVVTEISHRIYEERTDERKLIAADLHDEVLQPLFKVTLMAQVLKTDLATGKLLDMEEDLPELLTAAELASRSLRELIGDLRRSRVGSAGLASAINVLARITGERSKSNIEVLVESIGTDDEKELVIYHLVREALTNAVRHSNASRIWVEVAQDDIGIRATIGDDGVGFDVLEEQEGHYGIQIMRERVRSVGGEIYFDSEVGKGTLITAIFNQAQTSTSDT
jgi:signal transduction histidine kinase